MKTFVIFEDTTSLSIENVSEWFISADGLFLHIKGGGAHRVIPFSRIRMASSTNG